MGVCRSGIGEDGRRFLALPRPPEGEPQLLRQAPRIALENVVIHHWEQGPAEVAKLPRTRSVELRDGTRKMASLTWPWYLGKIEGASKGVALDALYDALLDPRGWLAGTGVHMKRVRDPSTAVCVVNIVPMEQSVCGPSAAGCFSWGGGRAPVIDLETGYVGKPAFLNIVNHEFGHACFSMHDMYQGAGHEGYVGVMGTWQAAAQSGYFPPLHEKAWAVEWLAGRARMIHDH